MNKTCLSLVFLLAISSITVFSQPREKIVKTNAKNLAEGCSVFSEAKLVNNPKPAYPTEAKIAGILGKVEVSVEIDEEGNVTKVESAKGNEIFVKSASDAALQAKFSPAICNGKAIKFKGVIIFNFAPVELTKEYFKPSTVEDFSDIKDNDHHFEAVWLLSENYRIAFGYADRKFHPEMFLTRGDFAHFLCQLLEMLDVRGKFANRIPSKIGLYRQFNPHNLKEIEFNPTAPYSKSVEVLLDKYGIVLANKDGNFDGDSELLKAEVIEIWNGVFGEDAVPINFLTSKDQETQMTRGEFAIYLKESLDVLTYKILP